MRTPSLMFLSHLMPFWDIVPLWVIRQTTPSLQTADMTREFTHWEKQILSQQYGFNVIFVCKLMQISKMVLCDFVADLFTLVLDLSNVSGHWGLYRKMKRSRLLMVIITNRRGGWVQRLLTGIRETWKSLSRAKQLLLTARNTAVCTCTGT